MVGIGDGGAITHPGSGAVGGGRHRLGGGGPSAMGWPPVRAEDAGKPGV
jgi:hypothetical protein